MSQMNLDLSILTQSLSDASSANILWLLFFALFVACVFEFVNGFHDTANAVATVIYTRSLRPWQAVMLSGLCNFVGVFLGGVGVAMAIVKLLPSDLLASGQMSVSMALIFAMLISALAWNLGTWYFGIPASSSHAMLGAIIGIGVGNAFMQNMPLSSGVNWSKAGDVGLALLISPLFGFGMSALGVYLLRRFRPHSRLQRGPSESEVPPLSIRAILIGTSSGVSFAHGSNDGQKGVGLIMLILIAVLPQHFSLNPSTLNSPRQIFEVQEANRVIKEELLSQNNAYMAQDLRRSGSDDRRFNPFESKALAQSPNAVASAALSPTSVVIPKILQTCDAIHRLLEKANTTEGLSIKDRFNLRVDILKLDSQIKKLDDLDKDSLSRIKGKEKKLLAMTEYAPIWVLIMVAISLGVGTTIGWKRIVVTIGEKIGRTHLTYGQGAISEMVAMSTIAVSAIAGVPVSTTHCLSSGVAGGMFANRSGVQGQTVRNLLLAWVLTLPVTVLLSAGLFIVFAKCF
jgi:phosphate/sulfate permease